MRNLAPIGDCRTNLALRRRQEERQMIENAERIAREVGTDTGTVIQTASKLPGDPRSLRGIPAIGRGITGAQPHTRPGHGLT